MSVNAMIYAYTIDFSYTEDEETENDKEERIPMPCGCMFFNDCSECSSYTVCEMYNDI